MKKRIAPQNKPSMMNNDDSADENLGDTLVPLPMQKQGLQKRKGLQKQSRSNWIKPILLAVLFHSLLFFVLWQSWQSSLSVNTTLSISLPNPLSKFDPVTEKVPSLDDPTYIHNPSNNQKYMKEGSQTISSADTSSKQALKTLSDTTLTNKAAIQQKSIQESMVSDSNSPSINNKTFSDATFDSAALNNTGAQPLSQPFDKDMQKSQNDKQPVNQDDKVASNSDDLHSTIEADRLQSKSDNSDESNSQIKTKEKESASFDNEQRPSSPNALLLSRDVATNTSQPDYANTPEQYQNIVKKTEATERRISEQVAQVRQLNARKIQADNQLQNQTQTAKDVTDASAHLDESNPLNTQPPIQSVSAPSDYIDEEEWQAPSTIINKPDADDRLSELGDRIE